MADDPWGVASVADAPPAKDPWGVSSVEDSSPAPLSGPVGGGNGVPVPEGMSAPAPATLGSSLGDVASTVGSHALNLVAGPAKAIATPPQNAGEKVAQVLGPGGLPLYRTAVEPSIAPAKQALKEALAGRYGNAARAAESAIPVVGPWADQVEKDVQDKGAVAGMAGLATDVLAPKAAGAGVAAAGDAMDATARGIINKGVVGARDPDFARDANLGRGYLENKIGPSASMQSIADKSGDAMDEVGKQIGDSIDQHSQAGKLIPADTIRKAIHPIIDKARGETEAPGVVADPTHFDQLKNSFEPLLQKADAQGGLSPRELWNVRHTMNKSLNWGDQTRANLTKTQQQVSGALGGVIEDAVPGMDELNENYKDLVKLHGRASKRAATGQGTLSGMASKAAMTGAGALMGGEAGLGAGVGATAAALADTIPVKTTAATALHGLSSVAPAAPVAALPATLAGVSTNAGNEQEKPKQDNAPENGGDKAPVTEDKPVQSPPPQAQSTTTPPDVAPVPEGVAPESHDFSVSAWVKSNPGGDVDEAIQHAESLGYEVTK